MAKFIELKVVIDGGSTYNVTVNTDYIVRINDNDHYRFIIMFDNTKILTKESYKDLITRVNS